MIFGPLPRRGKRRAVKTTLLKDDAGLYSTRDVRNSTWVEVNLDSIRQNIANSLHAVDTPALVVVKANGYGHGAPEVGQTAVSAGAKMLGVATIGEALELRESGITAPILIMGPVVGDELRLLPEANCSMVLWNREQLSEAAAAGKAARKRIAVHIKVDTGMARFGVQPDLAVEFIATASMTREIVVEGISTHLASSDVEDPASTLAQIAKFQKIVEELENRGLRPPIVHCANSAAAFRFPEARFDMVRLGISTYGVNPNPAWELFFDLLPAMTWKARILNLQLHEAGDAIGYGGEYHCARPEHIATIGAGYADGFRRVPKYVNEVLIRGLRVPVVGRLCMQHCMAALPASLGQEIHAGEEAVLLGTQGDEEITPSELAAKWGTNEWDVFCGINALIRRTYI
jgi:alanine racemase